MSRVSRHTRELRALLDSLPLPTPGESLLLERLRWALGDALPAAQRARMPVLPPLAEVRGTVLERQENATAGADVLVSSEKEADHGNQSH